MKNLLILATMLLTFSFANAQCKVYSGKGDYGGTMTTLVVVLHLKERLRLCYEIVNSLN